VSIFARRSPAQAAPADVARAQPGLTIDQWIRMAGGGAGITEGSVSSIETALTHSVVWRCAMHNAATLSSFPVHTYAGRDLIVDPLIVEDPAPGDMEQDVWVFAAALSMFLRGGAYAFVGPDLMAAQGRPETAFLLHPDRVDWCEKDGWTVDGKPEQLFPLGRLWHVPLYVMPGSPKGLNPLQYARRSMFPGMAAQQFGSNFFRDGAHPTSIIAPETDPGPTNAQALKDRVMSATTGGSREPLVLPQSIKLVQLQVNPEDSQFIELMRFSDEQVCRFMLTPPEEIGIAPSGSSVTYANREQRKQDYLQELLLPIRRLERAWTRLVAPVRTPASPRVRLNTAGLLRADTLTRFQIYEIAKRIKILTDDEMRELEDRPPLPADGERATPKEIAEILQKIYLAVGVVVSSDEARAIAAAAGADLPPGFEPTPGKVPAPPPPAAP
jgi:HK97 family phage portal protein